VDEGLTDTGSGGVHDGLDEVWPALLAVEALRWSDVS